MAKRHFSAHRESSTNTDHALMRLFVDNHICLRLCEVMQLTPLQPPNEDVVRVHNDTDEELVDQGGNQSEDPNNSGDEDKNTDKSGASDMSLV